MSNCSSLETSLPAGWENGVSQPSPSPHSVNRKNVMDNSPATCQPPAWENTTTQPNILPVDGEKVMVCSSETHGSSSCENTASMPTPLHPANKKRYMVCSSEVLGPASCVKNASICAPLHPEIEVKNEVCSSQTPKLPSNENKASMPTHPGSLKKGRECSPEMSHSPVWDNVGSQPINASPLPDFGQMVCGGCRQLLSYPQGAIHVKCPCCQIINFVLEEHQVGNVECGKCFILLMYPYGAPAVRCSSCCFVTKIGAHNIRPPLSVQQGHSTLPQNPGRWS